MISLQVQFRQTVISSHIVSIPLLLSSQTLSHHAETKPLQDTLQSKTTQQVVEQTTKTKSAEQATNKSKHTSQQKTNSSKNLTQRLSQQTPQRIQLLLRVRHARNLLLRIINRLLNIASKLLQHLRKTILFRRSITRSSPAFSISGDASVRVEAADDAVGFDEDLAGLFDKGADGIDELLFVEFFFWLAFCCVDCLLVLLVQDQEM